MSDFFKAAGIGKTAKTTPQIIKKKKEWDYVREEQKIDVSELKETIKRKNKKWPDVSGKVFGRGFGG